MNATQVVGLATFFATALLCARAGRRAGAVPILWWSLAAIYLLLTLDVAFDLRFAANRWIIDEARGLGAYASRRSVQPFLVVGLAAALLAGAAWLALRLRGAGAPARLAVMGAAASLSVLGAEMISLHALDALLYRPIGPLLAIALPWGASAAVVSLAALAAARG